MRTIGEILSDRWSAALVNLLLLLAALSLISERLYAGRNTAIILIILAAAILLLLGRWIYIAVRFRKSAPVPQEDTPFDLRTSIRKWDVSYGLSFIAFLILIGHIDRGNTAVWWIVGVILLICMISVAIALLRPQSK